MKKLGFYDLQKVQIRCWDALDAGNDAPMFTASEMLEMIEEVHRVRGLIVDMQRLRSAITKIAVLTRLAELSLATPSDGDSHMTKDALPDYTEDGECNGLRLSGGTTKHRTRKTKVV